MKKNILKIFVLLFTAALMITCVSKKKYLNAVARGDRLQADSLDTHSKLKACDTKVSSLENDKSSLQNEKTNLQYQNGSLASENQQVLEELDKLSKNSKTTIAEQARRLKALEDLIQSQRQAMNGLKDNISKSLFSFNPDEFSVNIKDGKVYVSLQEKLLFKSGSDVVDPKGRKALENLAGVLRTTADINVDIEGHTDSVPIKTQRFADNWDLSVARATSIVRILTDNGFDPKHITASGRGKYEPVQTNQTAEGRQANRRTEIIISPNLSKLYNLLNQ